MKVYKTPRFQSNFLFFDTETKSQPVKGDLKAKREYFWFGYILAYRRDEKRRTRIHERFFNDIEVFWSTLIDRLDAARPLWVFAHNIIFDLTVLDCWQRADGWGISVDLPVLDDPPVFLCCTHKRGKIHFVDTFNYWKCSVHDLGKQQGLQKLPMPKDKVYNDKWRRYCKRDVTVLALAVDNLINWLEDNDLGPLNYTIASTALATYKHRFMPQGVIHVHDNDKILAMERSAYHGGLTHTYYIGSIRRRVYQLDVNSLYPFVMLNPYPVKIAKHYESLKPAQLLKLMHKQGAMADVTIHTTNNPYPVYNGERLLEAVGTYRTILCGRELCDAIRAGAINTVHKAVLYETQAIFTEYVNYFWRKRLEYKRNNDQIGSDFTKLMLNSLYGKFGQRGFQWVDLTYDSLAYIYSQEGLDIPKCYEDERNAPSFGFGYHYWTPLNFPYTLNLRYTSGCLQVKVETGEHHESCPIIAAYVTSYARSYIRFLQGIAGRRNVYYTDTDSLFCNEMGFKRLSRAGYVDSRTIGKLKLEKTHNQITFYGPKDYVTPLQRTIKGIRKDAQPVCPVCGRTSVIKGNCGHCSASLNGASSFNQVQFEHIKSIMRRGPEPYILVKEITKTLKREYTKGTVSKSGWTEYPILEMT